MELDEGPGAPAGCRALEGERAGLDVKVNLVESEVPHGGAAARQSDARPRGPSGETFGDRPVEAEAKVTWNLMEASRSLKFSEFPEKTKTYLNDFWAFDAFESCRTAVLVL